MGGGQQGRPITILPGTGRWQAKGLTEGWVQLNANGDDCRNHPSTTGCAGGPPPRAGEDRKHPSFSRLREKKPAGEERLDAPSGEGPRTI